jgi:Zn-dependent metalloprotease
VTHVCRDPLRCIVPPTMLDRIARHGDAAQRDRALGTLARDATIRQARVQNQLLRGVRGHREGPDALAALENEGPNREIRDAQGSEQVVRAPVVRGEGDPPTGDPAVDEAYDGLGATYAFWSEAYGRLSIDDEGMPLRGVVHYGQDYDNAFWDGRRMVFGDGDGRLFLRFTRSLDVIGHELAHGVTEDENGLEYQGQSGALNESCSDVFGSLVKQHALGQTADAADWLIGADLLGPDVQGTAMRSMKAPGTAYDDEVLGTDPQPAHMEDFVVTQEDGGGVHINSGIPNRAFYVAATTLGGPAWERAGRVWYETARDRGLRSTATFADFARITVEVAAQLFGAGGEVEVAVRGGWEAVGVAWT